MANTIFAFIQEHWKLLMETNPHDPYMLYGQLDEGHDFHMGSSGDHFSAFMCDLLMLEHPSKGFSVRGLVDIRSLFECQLRI
jgi:hypothetical protein